MFQLFSMTDELLLLTGSMLTLGVNGTSEIIATPGVYYCPHPKDGEGNSFSLSVHTRGGDTPSPSHNTSTGPMSFPGVPH